MKAKYLFISFALGLGLAVGLLVVLGGWPVSAEMGANRPGLDVLAPNAPRQVCPSGCFYSSIQAAVDDASPGETILVAQGVYTDVHIRDGVTQVVYISKTVTILGGYAAPSFAEPPDPDTNATVLDAGGQGRVIYITGNISPTIEGLRLTGGNATGLGGWFGMDVGGGVYVVTATATISNNQIYSNTGIANSSGGGLFLHSSDATVSGNSIYSNTTDSCGAGVFVYAGNNATLSGNVIHHNSSNYDGGGVCSEEGFVTLRGNVIHSNIAPDYGGGVYAYHAIDTLVNNAVIDNYAGDEGSGLYISTSDYRLLHTTIARNTGGDDSGVHVTDDGGASHSYVVLTNTILVDQTAGVTVTALNAAMVKGVLWSGNGTNIGGAGFISRTSEYTGAPAFDADGYHLTTGSAAIDRGVSAGVAEDIDGQLRNTPDLGADEWRGEITVDGTTGGIITYVNGQGLTTTIEIVPGAVTGTVLLQFTPIPSASLPISYGLQYSAIAFDLDAFCDRSYYVYLPLILRGYSSASARVVTDAGLSSLVRGCSIHSTAGSGNPSPCSVTFQKPVTITIYYSDADIAGLNEDTLRLYYWTGSYWQDAATTCLPASTYITDTTTNLLQVPICHLSRYGMR